MSKDKMLNYKEIIMSAKHCVLWLVIACIFLVA